MTLVKFKRLKVGIKKYICLPLACLVLVCSGCGQNQAQSPSGNVELLEPVGVALSYETAARRNLYNASVYGAIVSPYVEEYQLEESAPFAAFDAYPGEEVKSGAVLLHADVKSYDERIEDMQESISEMDESYQEFLTDITEALTQPLADRENYTSVKENLEQQKPEEFKTVIDPETGEEQTVTTEEYEEWYYGDWGYKWCESSLMNNGQIIFELEEARDERKDLYELDRAYRLLQLERLKEDKENRTLISGMAGYVAGLRYLYEGDWVSSDQPVIAVCDPSRVELRCEYLSKTELRKAEDVYALVNGKRYEVEYEELSTEEYQKLQDQNGVVYSTFHVLTDAEELELGSYAAIVVKKESRENVVTVPKDAIQWDGNNNYVYLIDGNESIYTVVSTGMNDGLYTEILSGVKEGDKVLTDRAVTAGEDTVTVEWGKMSSNYSGTGYLYYPSEEIISNPVEYGTCYFVENLVALYQQVEKGQTLATVRVVPDQAEIGRNEQKLVRERERLEDLKRAGEEENKKAIAQKEKNIRELEELIAEMKADAAITEIKAPRNGIITVIPRLEEESLIGREAQLYYLADESTSYVIVEDDSGRLSYGNEVSIAYNDREGNSRTTAGEVVTMNRMSLSSSLVYDVALIKIPPEDLGNMAGSSMSYEGWWSRRSFQVTATIRSMDHVLLVPRSAVTESAGRTYVKVRLESGEIQYRSFIAGGYDASNYWVVEGLTEGMEVCLK